MSTMGISSSQKSSCVEQLYSFKILNIAWYSIAFYGDETFGGDEFDVLVS